MRARKVMGTSPEMFHSGSFELYTLPARLSTCYKYTQMSLP